MLLHYVTNICLLHLTILSQTNQSFTEKQRRILPAAAPGWDTYICPSEESNTFFPFSSECSVKHFFGSLPLGIREKHLALWLFMVDQVLFLLHFTSVFLQIWSEMLVEKDITVSVIQLNVCCLPRTDEKKGVTFSPVLLIVGQVWHSVSWEPQSLTTTPFPQERKMWSTLATSYCGNH